VEWWNNGVLDDLLYGVMANIVADYAVAGQADQQVAWGKKMISRLQNRPESVPLNSRWLADAYYFAGEFEKAEVYWQNCVLLVNPLHHCTVVPLYRCTAICFFPTFFLSLAAT
jgi:hypothetical protein